MLRRMCFSVSDRHYALRMTTRLGSKSAKSCTKCKTNMFIAYHIHVALLSGITLFFEFEGFCFAIVLNSPVCLSLHLIENEINLPCVFCISEVRIVHDSQLISHSDLHFPTGIIAMNIYLRFFPPLLIQPVQKFRREIAYDYSRSGP